MSAYPQFWVGRSRGKWDFLDRLSRNEVLAICKKLHQDVDHPYTPATTHERQTGHRYIDQVENGDTIRTLVMLAGQPYNIKWWKPEWLQSICIEPGKPLRAIEFLVRGRFAKLRGAHPDPHLLRALRRAGIAGAYTAASFASSPELVLWRPDAIVDARIVTLES